MNEAALKKVFEKFKGSCHFCGDEIQFDKHGYSPDLRGSWEVDHVVHVKHGGASNLDNYLPACTRCNQLRSGRSGRSLRLVLSMGLAAKSEAYHYKDSEIGAKLRRMRVEQRGRNWYRRMWKDLNHKGLTKQEFALADAKLRRRKVALVEALTEFEEEVLKELQAERGQKWDEVFEKLRKRYERAGTHKDWLRADRALGE